MDELRMQRLADSGLRPLTPREVSKIMGICYEHSRAITKAHGFHIGTRWYITVDALRRFMEEAGR